MGGSLPRCLDALETSGVLDNLRLLLPADDARHHDGPDRGFDLVDSDAWKTLEAAAWDAGRTIGHAVRRRLPARRGDGRLPRGGRARVVTGSVGALSADRGSGTRHGAAVDTGASAREVEPVAVPYATWDTRGEGPVRVWVPARESV